MSRKGKSKDLRSTVDSGYETRAIWERSPSPVEDWGSDADRDFDLEIVGEEVGYNGEIKCARYEVAWKDWKRRDGSSTTWEGFDTTSQTLPTAAWEAKRISALPDTPDIELWGTTDIANTATRERKQGYQEASEKERAKFAKDFDSMRQRMEDLLADNQKRYPQYFPPSATRPQVKTHALPSRTSLNTEAGPSRTHINAEAAGSSRNRTSTVSSPVATSSRAPVASSSRPPARTTLASPILPLPPHPPRRASPAASVSSVESVQFLGYNHKPALSKPIPAPRGVKRRASSSPSPRPSPSSRTLPHAPHQSSSASGPTVLPRRPLKRKADDIPARICGCGTLLPPPDVYRASACDACRSSLATKRVKDSAGTSGARGGSIHSETTSRNLEKTRDSRILVPSPHSLPGSMRKGKARETPKSLRLQTETAWAAAAHASAPDEGGAVGVSFVNDIDDEELPSTLHGDGWEFEYMEAAYYLPEILESLPTLHLTRPGARNSLNPLTENGRLVYCDCEPGTDCVDVARCGCQEDESEYAYTDGLFNFKYESYRVVIECNPFCACSMACPNRITQRPRKIPIEVFKTAQCGWGARAPLDVERGRVLGVYTGKLIPRAQALELKHELKEYCFDLDYQDGGQDGDLPNEESFSVDALRYGNWTRFINHSCAPNLRVQPVVYNTAPEQNVAFLAFIATQFIPARTEFTFDYDPKAQRAFVEAEEATGKGKRRSSAGLPSSRGTDVDGVVGCKCGAERCRGVVWMR
ncbi:hypothetical protein DFH07DRAFT_807059 [Mycena maculata]|uniref:SET domain-containing protein n=1 Tax=Mycena maculata TaxID=230809 RepID=A0AAD7JPQ8_9AGAR|nr:hypothetical protein DFH07DRAFT_807059 [Mycena maculata]